jgi:hypothetical protein
MFFCATVKARDTAHWTRSPVPRKCLILQQNRGLLLIFRTIEVTPKRPKKASIIPKNPTGSGRRNANLGRDKFEVDALLIQREGCRTEKMKTFGRLILETRKATRLTQKAVVSVFGAETVAKFYPLRK